MANTKTLLAESVAVRCLDLERRIAEAATAIADARATAISATKPAVLQEAQSQIEFSQLQRRRLIEERVALEVSRLEEAIEIANKALEQQSAIPTLVARRNELQMELDKVQHDMDVAQFDVRRLDNAIAKARIPLVTLQSERPIDAQPKQRLERELRQRLEALS